jgi:hypothetical protein
MAFVGEVRVCKNREVVNGGQQDQCERRKYDAVSAEGSLY